MSAHCAHHYQQSAVINTDQTCSAVCDFSVLLTQCHLLSLLICRKSCNGIVSLTKQICIFMPYPAAASQAANVFRTWNPNITNSTSSCQQTPALYRNCDGVYHCSPQHQQSLSFYIILDYTPTILVTCLLRSVSTPILLLTLEIDAQGRKTVFPFRFGVVFRCVTLILCRLLKAFEPQSVRTMYLTRQLVEEGLEQHVF